MANLVQLNAKLGGPEVKSGGHGPTVQCQRHSCWPYLPPANEVCEGYVLQVSVCPRGGGRAWRGHAWQGVCMAEGGMRGRGACMARGVCGRGACVAHSLTPPPTLAITTIRSMSGRYASCWNALLYMLKLI